MGQIKILQTTDSVSAVRFCFLSYKRERAVTTGTGEFKDINMVCSQTLPRQRQIIKAGIRNRGIKDFVDPYLKKSQQIVLRIWKFTRIDIQ